MDDDARWEAVAARDRGADALFVYAVRTTGVYCRPSCPSRRPARPNVAFFAGPDEAEAGGFRPCRRCRPGDGPGADRAAEAVTAACRVLEGDDGASVTLAELGRLVGLSPSHLRRTFTRLVGMTPRRYGAEVRLARAREALRSGAGVTAALYDAGYGSARAFYEGARSGLGMTPSAYRLGGEAQRIAFTVVGSRLGDVLVAATGEGICAVRFVEGTAPAEELAAEFPAAEIRLDDGGLAPAAERVVAAVEGDGAAGAGLPLDLRATAFRLRVWQALRAIPAGQTRSYTEVAAAIGSPRAVRAVAGACAANPVAVLVPCHRVVAAGGGLAGYRWGTDRKAALLRAEGWTGPTPRGAGEDGGGGGQVGRRQAGGGR